MNTARLRQFIRKTLLIEIGAGSSGYSFILSDVKNYSSDNSIFKYKFYSKGNTEYTVTIDKLDNQIDVSFNTDKNGRLTNEHDALKITQTVINCVKDSLNNNPSVNIITFTGEPKENEKRSTSSTSTQREKLYTAFIKKQFKYDKISKHGNNVSIKLRK